MAASVRNRREADDVADVEARRKVSQDGAAMKAYCGDGGLLSWRRNRALPF